MNTLLRNTLLILLCAAAFAPALRADDSGPPENELIAVLNGANAGWEAKYQACYNLRRMGTAASVPALAALLDDEHLSHMARYALEPLDAPEAGEALRAALDSVSDAHKIGIMTTLGVQRDTAAVTQIAALAQSDDTAVAEAALAALGRIGGTDAIAALLGMSGEADRKHPMATGAALLDAATRSEDDHAPLFEQLMDESWPEAIRLGAFRALAHAKPGQSPKHIQAALTGSNVHLRDFAAQLVAEVGGPKLTKRYAKLLAELPDEGKLALLRGLANRGDAEARRAVLAQLRKGSAPVKLAAMQALGSIGTPEDVPLLAKNLEGDADTADYARKSLTTLRVDGIDEALAGAIEGSSAVVEAGLLGILAERGAPQALTVAIDALDSDAAVVRVAALETVSQLGTAEQAPSAIGLLDDSDTGASEVAAKALGRICAREGDAALAPIKDALTSASPAVAAVLVRNLGRIGTPDALAALTPAIDSEHAEVSDAALATLAEWPGQEARPQLLALAKAGGDAREDALKGFVRLARAEPDAGQKVAALSEASALAQTKQERWMILAAWGTLPDPAALAALSKDLDDEEVANEAASALMNIAPELAKRDDAARKAVAEALERVVNQTKSQAIRDRASSLLKDLR
ncbi:MAG: hypothetical protein GC168_02020 [Candidatus Hydrogenedens sp.]|nr:hypothetical protein [Candidatus Hydrogenedens sp.]